MSIKVIKDQISPGELQAAAKESFGDMVKAVVDVEKEILAVGGGMHADAEQKLLGQGSRQESLWGINIYPDLPPDRRIQFESLINIRPRQNRSMEIDDAELRSKIAGIVNKIIQWNG
ncbi:MAG: DUF5674 family protein [Deltaproteobacteria bacterium]|nr:DUF5674 family protein [Deltaproteobacteria bacterium]MDZ4244127.1 DUF5674 family protein [Candidatus Doudnabacteria bacterium]